MTDRKNRTCICCSKNYRYCPDCSEFANLEPWHSIFHDANCREIFNAVSAYLGNEKTKAETKARLDKCDLSNKENFKKTIKDAIDEIYKEDVNVKDIVKVEVQDTVSIVETKEESKIEEIVLDDKVQEEPATELPKITYNKKKKR